MTKINLTADMLLQLEKHARKVGTLDKWVEVAKEWIEGMQDHVDLAFHPELGWAVDPIQYENLYNTNRELEAKLAKITPVYSAIMEWTGSEASIDVLKKIIKDAKENDE